jgi:hypothetical protein
VVVIFFAEEEAVVFVAAQMIAHNAGQQIDHLVDFVLAHAWNKRIGKAGIAEVVKKCD